jgi:hypothetical protein
MLQLLGMLAEERQWHLWLLLEGQPLVVECDVHRQL